MNLHFYRKFFVQAYLYPWFMDEISK
jgi:hypothetical protein